MASICLWTYVDARVEGLAKWFFDNQKTIQSLVATSIGGDSETTIVIDTYMVGVGQVKHGAHVIDIGFNIGPLSFDCTTEPKVVVDTFMNLIVQESLLCNITTNWGVICKTSDGGEIFKKYELQN